MLGNVINRKFSLFLVIVNGNKLPFAKKLPPPPTTKAVPGLLSGRGEEREALSGLWVEATNQTGLSK